MKRISLFAAVLALFAAGVAGQFLLARHRPVKTAALNDSAIAALGGLRSLASEVAWFRADRLQGEGRYVELAQLATTLTRLDPYDAEVWQYAADNLAYNVSAMMPRLEDRWRWVDAAIRLVRDEGLAVNPAEGALYRQLASLFELKLGTNLDAAHELYRARWKAIVQDVASRAQADPARADAIWGEIGMKPAAMREIAARDGITDWTDPLSTAIYWAEEGLAVATEKSDRALLAGIVRQCKNMMAKKARAR